MMKLGSQIFLALAILLLTPFGSVRTGSSAVLYLAKPEDIDIERRVREWKSI